MYFAVVRLLLNVPQDEEVSEEDEDTENQEETKERVALSDELWSSLKKPMMTSGDFHAMLGSYRKREESRRKVRAGESERHNDAIKAKLKARQNRQQEVGVGSLSCMGNDVCMLHIYYMLEIQVTLAG